MAGTAWIDLLDPDEEELRKHVRDDIRPDAVDEKLSMSVPGVVVGVPAPWAFAASAHHLTVAVDPLAVFAATHVTRTTESPRLARTTTAWATPRNTTTMWLLPRSFSAKARTFSAAGP